MLYALMRASVSAAATGSVFVMPSGVRRVSPSARWRRTLAAESLQKAVST
ncbi:MULTISPECIES: hypothetical protein [unclassified Streptomyces]